MLHSPVPQTTLSLTAGSQLVVATHNNGKFREIGDILQRERITALPASQFGLPEPVEDGDSFEANAIIKAQSGADHAPGHIVLAYDSGLEVDALDGAPGIYSARWAGERKDFALAASRIYDELRVLGMEPDGQSARFVCVLALAKSGIEPVTFRGIVDGHLCFPARGSGGFGYDPIFIPSGYSLSFGEMESHSKHAISHRADAFARLRYFIRGESS